MSLADTMYEYVQQHGSVTAETIANAIPELRDAGGTARALLLLRLNPQFERIGEKWTTRGGGQSEADTVREAAERYFASIDRPGAPLKTVAAEVAKVTNIPFDKVEPMLPKYFMTVNTNIFNRRRQ